MSLKASHAQVRASERYGISFSRRVRAEVVAAIQAGRSKPVRSTTNTRTVHDVTLADGTVMRVVYNRRLKDVITVLPPPDKSAGQSVA